MLPQPRRAALSTAPRRPCCRPAAVAAPSRLRLCAGRLRWQAPPRRCGGDGAPRTAVLASGESGWATRTARSGGACWLRSETTGRPAQTGPNGLTDTPGAPPAGPSHRARAQDHPPRAPGRERALSCTSSLVCAALARKPSLLRSTHARAPLGLEPSDCIGTASTPRVKHASHKWPRLAANLQ